MSSAVNPGYSTNAILNLIRRGLISDSEIAEALQISPATAATHVQHIRRKTGLHN
ncbi:MAG: response regulator transcription factor, partial [Micromonosporaceae bacterium]